MDGMNSFVDNVLDDIHIPNYRGASPVSLKDKIAELDERIESCPISDVADRFVCPKCGSRGLVTVPIKCTECGIQAEVGWHPS